MERRGDQLARWTLDVQGLVRVLASFFFFRKEILLSLYLSLAMSKNWHRRADTKNLESMSVFEQQRTWPSPNPILLLGYSFWARGGVGASSLRCWHWFRISSSMSVCTYCPPLPKYVVENDEKCYISWSVIAFRNGRLENGSYKL